MNSMQVDGGQKPNGVGDWKSLTRSLSIPTDPSGSRGWQRTLGKNPDVFGFELPKSGYLSQPQFPRLDARSAIPIWRFIW
jgi:hypothetical protein